MRLLVTVLVLIGVSALFGSLGLLSSEPFYIAPSLQKLDPTTSHRIILFLSFPYSMAALLAAYAAWGRREWAPRAYVAFAVFGLLLAGFFLYIAPVPKDAFSLVLGLVFFVLIGWALWKGWRTMESELKSPRRAA
jgi:O-antigen/teichoic acid export membrane protein